MCPILEALLEFPAVPAGTSAEELKNAFEKLLTKILCAEKREDPQRKKRKLDDEGATQREGEYRTTVREREGERKKERQRERDGETERRVH